MSQKMAVETFGLTKRFKTALAVDSINLQVPAGAICGFLGKNGAGKTTTIKMLTGLKRPTSGEFAIMGKKEQFGKGIGTVGYLPDVPGFYGYMTGFEFLMLCAKLAKVPDNQQKSHVEGLLKQVGLFGVKTKTSGYSRGMRQRLGIAQALINNPSVVFLDEPISALDPMGRRDVMEIIGELKGTTVVFSTHILSDVENICDYIIIIEKGKIMEQDTLEGLKARYLISDTQIEFYNDKDCADFITRVQQKADMDIAKLDPMRISVKSQKMDDVEISKLVSTTIADLAIPFKSFGVQAPTLDDIFYEVTK
ncbi:MAG: ABC transporter ATP-binding protein [Defluviitaleaceae bacterium]|nr:ABC transporter ATP-binding protein [Defluviitaleaceae bacterium]